MVDRRWWTMQIRVLENAGEVALEGARFVAARARECVAARGRFVLAVSGGSTPWQMLAALAGEELPWESVHIVQVDERVAPEGHADRNLTHLRESLKGVARLKPEQIHPMLVNDPDLNTASARYAALLHELCGTTGALDLVHLGLGSDGHTASLVPGDPVLEVVDVDVAPTGVYQGRRRMTLTYPILNRARCILWLITGDSKAQMLARMRQSDPGIPAGRVASTAATILADRSAAKTLPPAD